jgi:hypothetical protein
MRKIYKTITFIFPESKPFLIASRKKLMNNSQKLNHKILQHA